MPCTCQHLLPSAALSRAVRSRAHLSPAQQQQPSMRVQAFAALAEGDSGVDATFALAFLEGMHWKKAASLFNRADVVVSPHGAQARQGDL